MSDGSSLKSLEGQSLHHNGDAPPARHDSTIEISKVHTSGGQGEYVHLGGKTYLKSDLLFAFGGEFNPGVHKLPRLALGNSTPMGLFSFATTTIILSFINAHARGISNSSIMLGAALFYGGCVQIVAGIWELVMENTFGATVFTAYGGFWLSFGVIKMNGFNIANSYSDAADLANAMGLFFVGWALVTFFFLMCTLRSTVAMFSLMLFLMLTFIMLASSEFASANGSASASNHLGITAGVFGCITAMIAYYNAMAGLLSKENGYVRLRPIYMPGAIRPDDPKLKEA